MSTLILPGHPLFDLTLQTPRPDFWAKDKTEEFAMVVDSDSGLMRPATRKELNEYVCGGEYDERLAAIGENDDY